MRKELFSLSAVLACASAYAQATHVITASGVLYTPDSIVVKLGDTIEFNVGPTHPTLEVDQAMWNSNGTTAKPGGFDFPSGNGKFVVNQAQVYYYVCTAHIAQGMKGRIFVNSTVSQKENALADLRLYPNPVKDVLQLELQYSPELKHLRIIDQTGKTLRRLELRENQSLHSYDISELKAGSYFLMIDAAKKVKPLPFTKN